MSFKKIYTHLKSNIPDTQQLNSGQYCTWQFQDSNTNWKHDHLSQENQSNLVCYNRMSGNLEDYNYNIQNSWESKEGLINHFNTPSSFLVPSIHHKEKNTNYNSYSKGEACLILKVPPENRFRYRYDTEMSGTHGSLQGIRTEREKSVPTVELLNYPFEALIRVTLVICQEKGEQYPHPHSLFVKEKLYQKKAYVNWDNKRLTKTGHYSDPHYVKVGVAKNDYTARFEGMCIINSKKENFHSSVKEKLQIRYFEQGYNKDGSLTPDESEELDRKVELAVRSVDVDFVSLCFEAFREENGRLFSICPPLYSEPIGNSKSAKTGKLKISKINKCSGSCKGGDEIWLLVEKINKKGLVVRFSEENNGKVIWESCIKGEDLTLHHQYAIVFKTPMYKDTNITSEVEVLMRLERTTQPNQPCDYSEPITFVYEPIKNKNSKGDNLCRKESILGPLKQIQTKRPRTDSCLPPFNCHNKRKTDDLELESMNFEDSTSDLEQLLFDSKDSFGLDQALAKFNVEEFLRFISSDDIDMPIQRDGVSHNSKSPRDFLYKLYMIYSKLDESDVKKLTEQISNFRVSKKEVAKNKGGNEKDQVKDAASTLLSLRSKAMVNNSVNVFHEYSKERETLSHVSVSNKTDSLNRILDSCTEPDLEVQSPLPRFHLPTSELPLPQREDKKNHDWYLRNGKVCSDSRPYKEDDLHGTTLEPEPLGYEIIKKETLEAEDSMEVDKMENICQILNENGSWQKLANVWKFSSAIPSAKASVNPTKYILDCAEEMNGVLELEKLREVLNLIDEKKTVAILDEILAKKICD